MGIADALTEHGLNAGRPKCKMCDILRVLNPDDREALEDALADARNFSAPAIKSILAEEGFSISRDTIGDHRRGVCNQR
jgi:hypothetical protein